ncbi:hypothetical protein F2Q70_00012935 [Brassica cretica]|uniref:Uncharacterized protein n=1 Tax=Brassica cretica TaxID=69181 RepID=A0A8S9M4Z9_BRACR|nr:hypothetical protein F2Q70_00012935 [Brassica cretica]
MSSKSSKNLDMHRIKSAAMDSDKIVEAEIGSVHEVSLVEHAVEKNEDQGYIEKMESMIEKILKIQQKTSAYLNLRLDVLYKELNGKLETLNAHVMMLDAQVSQTAEAVKKQEALFKGKAMESERHQTSLCFKTTEKISQQSAEAPEQKQNLAETSFVESVDRRHLPEKFEDSGPTADSNRQPAIPESASVDIRTSTSVNFQYQESIDTKPSVSVDTIRLSEQPETEKFKSGGRNKNRKKKKKRNADVDSLSVVRLQCQEGSLEYRVRCGGGSESFTKEPKLISNTKPDTTACLGAWYMGSDSSNKSGRFRDDLEESGDFGVFWSLSSAELHRRVRCLAMDGELPTIILIPSFDTRESCRGDEGLSFDDIALVSIDSDARMWAKRISRPFEAQKPHQVTKIPLNNQKPYL